MPEKSGGGRMSLALVSDGADDKTIIECGVWRD